MSKSLPVYSSMPCEKSVAILPKLLPMPFQRRNSRYAVIKYQQAVKAFRTTAAPTFSGNVGIQRQIQESNQGYRTGYFVCGGEPGMLGITNPSPRARAWAMLM